MGALYDLVGFSTTTTGTGTITAGSALTGLRPLSTVPDGTVISYSIKSGSNYETGTGTVGGSGTTLTRSLLSSTTGSLLNLTGTSEVRCSPNAGDFLPSTEVATFAALPAAGAVTVGRVYTVLAPVCTGGLPGTQWVSDGTLWRPAGAQTLGSSAVQIDGVAGGTTTAQMLLAVLVQGGVLLGCSRIRFRVKVIASGTDTAARRQIIYMGSTGTASDTNMYQNTGGFASSNRVATMSVHLIPQNATTLKGAYLINGAVAEDTISSSNTATFTRTVPSMASAIYLSYEVLQGASPASTISIDAWQLLVE